MLSDNFARRCVGFVRGKGNHEAIRGETWVISADQGLISRGHPVDFHAQPAGKLQQTDCNRSSEKLVFGTLSHKNKKKQPIIDDWEDFQEYRVF